MFQLYLAAEGKGWSSSIEEFEQRIREGGAGGGGAGGGGGGEADGGGGGI